MRIIISCVFLILIVACQLHPLTPTEKAPEAVVSLPQGPQEPENPAEIPSDESPVQVVPRLVLSWENGHSERAGWSDYLVELVRAEIETYRSAQDVTWFCPSFKQLGEEDQVRAIAELWVAVAYHESGFNPSAASVDVGSQSDKNTWSVGLFQMSVVDQRSYNLPLGLYYSDLVQSLPNIRLAQAVAVRQIKKRGLLVVPSSPYWAVLYHGKYDQTAGIKFAVRKYAPKCG